MPKKYQNSAEVVATSLDIKELEDRTVIKAETQNSDHEPVELGESKTVSVKRFSGSNNAIVDFEEQELNIGPLDCDTGTQVEVKKITGEYGICLHREAWCEGYLAHLKQMIPWNLPEDLPEPENDPIHPGLSDKTDLRNVSEAQTKSNGLTGNDVGSTDIDSGLKSTSSNPVTVPEDPQFKIGNHYVRKELHDQFKGNRQKGISSPKDEDFVFVFTGPSGEKYGYDDELLPDGTLIYYGEGRVGDMEFTENNGNAKIRDHAERGLTLHVFEEASEDGIVSYVGEYEYEDHEWTTALDDNGDKRRAIMFRLVPAGGTEVELEEEEVEAASPAELFEMAQESTKGASGSSAVSGDKSRKSRSGKSYNRSEIVKRFALRSADGICQGCGEEAPFIDTTGKPFLEVHHLHRLSDGGPDLPENVIALCPNCHRRRHNGQDGDGFNQYLIKKAEERNKNFSTD